MVCAVLQISVSVSRDGLGIHAQKVCNGLAGLDTGMLCMVTSILFHLLFAEQHAC